MTTRKGELMTMEKKGRIMVPKEFRGNFLGKLMLTAGKKCLVLLTEEDWNKTAEERLSGLKGLELRKAERVLYGSTFKVELDHQGRVLIPPPFRKYVLLDSEEKALVVKVNNHLEIWNNVSGS